MQRRFALIVLPEPARDAPARDGLVPSSETIHDFPPAAVPDQDRVYTKIKKDIFHAFDMVKTPIRHGLRKSYLRTLRDHLFHWDPIRRASVERVYIRHFGCDFNKMMDLWPKWVLRRCPRYVPPPSVLVPAITQVMELFGSSVDATTGAPLFNAEAWKKADAVKLLAKEGYLSDPRDVPLYESAGFDKYGLELFTCLRGTNKVEGGPHTDIYRKWASCNGETSGKLP